jgi:tetratricopeptide (TPR) repeat protein
MVDEYVDRRRFLRRAGLAVGAGAALPLVGAGGFGAVASATSNVDPDQLLREGRFAEAERGFRKVLRRDPDNAHAAARVGYIALLSNRFSDAETFLTKAVGLAPEDTFAQLQLGDCFVRQDKLARAVSPLRASGIDSGTAYAELYASMTGTPWQMRGAQRTRIPFLGLEPYPIVEARLRGGEPRKFFLDTGATLGLSKQVAEEIGLRVVSTFQGGIPGQTFTLYLGVLDSIEMGDIELRNVPVIWHDGRKPSLPDGSQTAGAIGTTLFYHFLTTMDYANQALILRRKTRAQLHRFQAEARHAGVDKLPLWLAGDHLPCTLGSLRDYGPRMVRMDTGGQRIGVVTTVEIAEQVGIEVDYAHPEKFNGTIEVFPIVPDRISLGRAVGRNVRGIAGPLLGSHGGQILFDTIANFTHNFFKPFAITFDYTDMNLYITGESLRDRW